MGDKDILGNDLTAAERLLMEAYEGLKSLLEEDLAPSVRSNVAEAVASLWQALNNLALTDERPAL